MATATLPSTVDESPDESQGSQDPETHTPETPEDDWGFNNRQAPLQIQKAILKVFGEAQLTEEFPRRQEVLQDTQSRFYCMGIQHIYKGSDNCYQQAYPGQQFMGPNGQSDNFGEYIDDYNIFTAFSEIQTAKLTESSSGIDFKPLNPEKTQDIEASNAAEGMRHEYDRNNDLKNIAKSRLYHMQMGGRFVIWTRTDDAPEKYGTNANGQPRRQVISTVHGCLESKVPLFMDCQPEMWYTILYDDPDIRIAKTKYSWIAKKLSAGQTCLHETAYERSNRLGVLQGSQASRVAYRIGDSIKHLISRGHGWIRLAGFVECDEPYDGPPQEVTDPLDGTKRQISVKEKIAERYPNGVHACVVGQQYAESWDQSMDDCLDIGHAYIAKGQSRLPIMKPMIVIQDRFNTTMNSIAEEFDFNCSETWVAVGMQEFAAITKQRSAPGAMRNLKEMPPGGKIQDYVYRITGGDITASQQQYLEFLMGPLPQFVLSVPPSLWGSASPDLKTASGLQLASSQATGVLGAFWSVCVWSDANVYYHNCLAIMNDDDYPEQIVIQGPTGQNVTVRKESLTKGDFRAFPDTQSGFPESTAAKAQKLNATVNQLLLTPLGPQFFSSPDNVAFYVAENGLPELILPESVSRDKQLREIEQLLGEAPIMAQQLVQMLSSGSQVPDIIDAIGQLVQAGQQQQEIAAAASQIAGQATPVQPPFNPDSIARSSVQVWKSDYHTYESKKCKDWLSSDARYSEEKIGRLSPDGSGDTKPNIAGILNVYLHMLKHDMYAAQEAPPPMAPIMKPPPVLPGKPGAPPAPTAAPGAPAAAQLA